MIVPMKKASLVLLAAARDQALEELRKLGVLHIESEPVASEAFTDLRERRNHLGRVLRALATEDAEPENRHDHMTANDIAEALEELETKEEALRERRERLTRERDRLAIWGSFNPDDIRDLATAGVIVRLYLLTRDELKSLDESVTCFRICKQGGLTGVACVSDAGIPDVAEFQLPEMGSEAIMKELERCDSELALVAAERKDLATHTPIIEEELTEIAGEIDLEEARLAMGLEGSLAHVTGYLPADLVPELESQAAKSGWGVLIRDPDPEDSVPTLIRNPKAVGIIKPVFNLLGTIPGYREHDISLLFLVFFALFFAMIIGDAGYGGVFLAGTMVSMIGSKRNGTPVGQGQVLLLVLSIATVVWGSVTGTWFGSEAIAGSRPFSLFVIPRLSSFNPRSSEFIKYLCFIIGTVQIVIAHIWNFLTEIRKKPRIRAFAQIGWISMLCGLYYLVLNVVLDPFEYPLPEYALWLIGAGLVMVILFSSQEGKFFRGILKGISGLLTTFLDSISAFADVISYIRLFAVGLATVEIAKSFNAMAADMGSSAVGIAGAVLILLLGHTLNLAMGALSVVVHGVRLNMLEFSGHLGMEWTGIAYAPLQKTTGNESTEPKES